MFGVYEERWSLSHFPVPQSESPSYSFLKLNKPPRFLAKESIYPSIWKTSFSNETELTPVIMVQLEPLLSPPPLILTAGLYLLMPCFAYLKSQPVLPGVYNGNVSRTSGMGEIGGWKTAHIVGKDLSEQK